MPKQKSCVRLKKHNIDTVSTHTGQQARK